MTEAVQFRMHPRHVLQADQLLKASLYRALLAGEFEWSGWWTYTSGWSDQRIAETIFPRLSADHIANLRELRGAGAFGVRPPRRTTIAITLSA